MPSAYVCVFVCVHCGVIMLNISQYCKFFFRVQFMQYLGGLEIWNVSGDISRKVQFLGDIWREWYQWHDYRRQFWVAGRAKQTLHSPNLMSHTLILGLAKAAMLTDLSPDKLRDIAATVWAHFTRYNSWSKAEKMEGRRGFHFVPFRPQFCKYRKRLLTVFPLPILCHFSHLLNFCS